MFQYAIFLIGVLRTAPLATLLVGIDGTWLARFGHLLSN
jgi:hypothetical protein